MILRTYIPFIMGPEGFSGFGGTQRAIKYTENTLGSRDMPSLTHWIDYIIFFYLFHVTFLISLFKKLNILFIFQSVQSFFFFKFKGLLLFWSVCCMKSTRNISSMIYWLKILSKLSRQKRSCDPSARLLWTNVVDFCCFFWNGAVPGGKSLPWIRTIILGTSFSEIFAEHKET